MGVNYLWKTLKNCCEKKQFSAGKLRNKTMAIDLSCWIVRKKKTLEKNIHLSITYDRTACLLKQGVLPVFVLDGEALELKQETVKQRRQPRSRDSTSLAAERRRNWFVKRLKECEKMLRFMGLECVQAEGEGEAMCAYLNADGIVDGCISQDGDCFLYGARVIYKDFEFDEDGKFWGRANVYNMKNIENKLKLDKDKMIAFALLCGCDYTKGLKNIGAKSALNLFKHVDDGDILQRLKSWKTDGRLDGLKAQLANKKLCTSCGHEGNIKVHSRIGCSVCGMEKSCSTDYKNERKLIENEIKIREAAELDREFPNKKIIDEYLVRKGNVPSKKNLKWQKPELDNLVSFMNEKLGSRREWTRDSFRELSELWESMIEKSTSVTSPGMNPATPY